MDITTIARWTKEHKKALIIGILLVLLAMLLSSLFFRVDAFRVTRLHIKSDNQSVSIDNGVLRAHNGAFFYKRSLTGNAAPTVLGGGVKLPGITHALWAGDKGVILNFDQSFIRTAVEDVANRNGLSYEEKARSTWYFDFSDNSLHHIGDYLLYSKAHYFDSKKNVLYYLEADEGLALHAFNTATKQDQITPLSVQFGTITQLDKCGDSSKVCITGKTLGSPTDTAIYSIEDSGTAKKDFSVEGEFYPVLGSSYGLALERKDLIPLDEEDSMVEYKKGALINIKTGKRVEINRQLTPDNFLHTTYGEDGDKLAVLGGDSNENYTTAKQMPWGAITQSGRLTYDDGDVFDSGIVIDSAPTANSILLKTTEGEYGIFAQSGYMRADFSKEDQDNAIDTARTCTKNVSNTRVEYDDELGKISFLVADDQNFNSNVSTINQCLVEKVATLYNYELSFTSYDLKSGRTTSY